MLPLVAFLLLGVHLFLVQRHNVHVPASLREEARRRPGIPFVPDFTLRELVVWLIGLALLAALAAFYPWDLGSRADPFASAPAGIKPEWYFLFLFQTLKLLPPGSSVWRASSSASARSPRRGCCGSSSRCSTARSDAASRAAPRRSWGSPSSATSAR